MLVQYVEETEELAMKGLMENRHILDIIADKLLEDSRITGLVYSVLIPVFVTFPHCSVSTGDENL